MKNSLCIKLLISFSLDIKITSAYHYFWRSRFDSFSMNVVTSFHYRVNCMIATVTVIGYIPTELSRISTIRCTLPYP
jgi:hypothetical protein